MYPNLCFTANIRKNVHPCKPFFYYLKVVCKGYTLHGLVNIMHVIKFKTLKKFKIVIVNNTFAIMTFLVLCLFVWKSIGAVWLSLLFSGN